MKSVIDKINRYPHSIFNELVTYWLSELKTEYVPSVGVYDQETGLCFMVYWFNDNKGFQIDFSTYNTTWMYITDTSEESGLLESHEQALTFIAKVYDEKVVS